MNDMGLIMLGSNIYMMREVMFSVCPPVLFFFSMNHYIGQSIFSHSEGLVYIQICVTGYESY